MTAMDLSPFADRGITDIDTSGEDEALIALANSIAITRELGATGLKRAGGWLDEEFLPQLRGQKSVLVFKEMSENDPLVGALLFVIRMLLRNVDWRVEPAGKSKQDAQAAKLVETAMEDMTTSWQDFITEILSCLVYGWSWHEIVYKRRSGLWTSDARNRSKFSDGMIGWRKMPIRAQETLLRWAFDETGDVRAMVQLAPPHYKTVAIPIERSLLFRFTHHKGNPEGVSLLRTAYRSWFMKKRLEEFEAIGVERDLAGLPIFKVPADYLRAQPGTDKYKAVQGFKTMIKGIRRNEQEGLVLPLAFDQDSKQPLYSLELLGGGGARAFNTDGIIRRYEERILMSVLADFIMVGHQASGSYSLHTDKTGIFRTSLNAIAGSIADVLNRHAVPKLFLANAWRPESLPQIKPDDVDAPDIAVLGQFMSAMANNGLTWFPDPTMENFIRKAARLPELDEDSEERRRAMQMRTEATAFANATAEYLAAQQQAQMAAMPPEEQAAVEGRAQGVSQQATYESSGQAERDAQQAAAAQEEAAQQQAVAEDDRQYQRATAERDFAMRAAESQDARATSARDHFDALMERHHARKQSERELALKERQAEQGAAQQERSEQVGRRNADREFALKDIQARHSIAMAEHAARQGKDGRKLP